MAHLLFCAAMIVSAQEAILPDTPQGRAVAEYIAAFNTGDQSAANAVIDKYTAPGRVRKRTPEQRAEAFKQLRDAFTVLKVTRVERHSDTEIVVIIPRNSGGDATWTFTFESGTPPHLAGISVSYEDP